MYFEKEIGQGRAFMELERRGDGRYAIKRRGFVSRYKGEFVQPQPWQATESPLIHDGSQNTLSTTQDARNSTQTGTTLAGPNGSGQFLCVVVNGARTVQIASSASGANFGSSGNNFYGILQNKPRAGDAADVGIFGVSKVVAGSTSITAGTYLNMSSAAGSSANGTVGVWVTGSGPKIGMALEGVTSFGQVITALIFNMGVGST